MTTDIVIYPSANDYMCASVSIFHYYQYKTFLPLIKALVKPNKKAYCDLRNYVSDHNKLDQTGQCPDNFVSDLWKFKWMDNLVY